MMTLAEFLDRVLPSTGSWFVSRLATAGGMRNTAVTAGDVATVERLINAGNTTGDHTFFGTSSYQPINGTLARNRACAQLGQFRAMRVDLDTSFLLAAEALSKFNNDLGLPSPLLVSSGRGLHAYWMFDRDVSYDEWQELANRLWWAAKTSNLLGLDDNVREPERLLRLPGSVNPKSGATVAVVFDGSPEAPEVYLRRLPPVPPGAIAVPSSVALQDDGDELSAGMEYPPYSAVTVIKNCAVYGGMLASGGAGVQEPQWKRTLDMINRASESDEDKWAIAVAMSSGHATYSIDGLRKKWAQVKSQGHHPATCATLASGACDGCPWRGKVKSPVSIRPRVDIKEEAGTDIDVTVITQEIDGGKFRLNMGHIEKFAGVSPDGKKIFKPLIADFRMVRARSVRENQTDDGRGGGGYTVVVFTSLAGKELTIHYQSAADERTKTMAFEKGGVHLAENKMGVLHFMSGFINFLENSGARSVNNAICGWSDKHSSFVLEDKTISNGVVKLLPSRNDETKAKYASRGSREVQLTTLNNLLVTPTAQFIIALSAATPLMPMTKHDGAIVSIYSPRSGVGKSTLLNAAASLWGSPVEQMIVAQTSWVAISKILGNTNSLPNFLDEMTGLADDKVGSFLYNVSQGKGKHRLTSGGAELQSNVSKWSSILFGTTNTSLVEKASGDMSDSDAQVARLLEVYMQKFTTEVPNFDYDISENFGHPAEDIAKALTSRTAVEWKKLVQETTTALAKQLGLSSSGDSNRFRLTLGVLAVLGVDLCRQAGLNVDSDVVLNQFKEALAFTNRSMADLRMTPVDYIRSFISSNNSRIARMIKARNIAPGTPTYFSLMPDSRDISAGEIYMDEANSLFACLNKRKLLDYVRDKRGNVSAFREWIVANPTIVQSRNQHTFARGSHLAYTDDALFVHQSILVGQQGLSLVGAPAAPTHDLPSVLTGSKP